MTNQAGRYLKSSDVLVGTAVDVVEVGILRGGQPYPIELAYPHYATIGLMMSREEAIALIQLIEHALELTKPKKPRR